jgi:hypothetical protein
MRDLVWFRGDSASDNQPILLHRFLRRVAEDHLETQGGVVVPRSRRRGKYAWDATGADQYAEGRNDWSWLTLALPEDLLRNALPRDHGSPAAEVIGVSPAVAAMLQHSGFAETHAHLGAAVAFPVIWSSCLRSIASSRFKEKDVESPGAGFREGKDLAAWLLRAAIARFLVGLYVAGRRDTANEPDEPEGLSSTPFERFLAGVRKRLRDRRGAIAVTAIFDTALTDLCTGRLTRTPMGPTFAQLQSLYADVTDVRLLRPPRTIEEVHRLDPLWRVFAGQAPGWSPEGSLVVGGLRLLEEGARSGRRDPLFERLFWQSVRIRCLFYRHLVQRPMTPGLQWFVRFFRRLKPVSGSLPRAVHVEAAEEICGKRFGLKGLELRVGPEPTLNEALRRLRCIEDRERRVRDHGWPPSILEREGSGESFRNTHDPAGFTVGGSYTARRDRPRNVADSSISGTERGYVIHFVRDRGRGFKGGDLAARWRGTNADPASFDNPTGYRFAQFYLARRAEALVFARMLTAFPVSLELLRGIDLCTDEVGIPTWVVAPLLRYVRSAGEAASAALRRGLEHVVPPMKTAVHAGEDFVHLLSGMRRLHESIQYFQLRPGDRIGHGLALGVDPERWASESGHVAMTQEDRLLDLIWTMRWLERADLRIGEVRAPAVEAEIFSLSQRIFTGSNGGRRAAEDDPPTSRELAQLVEDLHDEAWLMAVRFPTGPLPRFSKDKPHRRKQLLAQYLTDPSIFRRCKEPKWVDPSGEGPMLKVIQDAMRDEVSRADLIIEVNPSSNLLIGHVPDLVDHPLWRLRPAPHMGGASAPAQTPLTICVGSDDPLTFATSLRQEYQLLHDTLISAGASSSQADRWIDEVRRVGLERRFTVPRSPYPLTLPLKVTTRLDLPP